MILISAGVDDGFPPNIWLCGTGPGVVGFTVAAVCVWRGAPGARIVTWLVTLMSAPFCAGLTALAVFDITSPSVPPPPDCTTYPCTTSDGDIVWPAGAMLDDIVIVLSVLALMSALVLLTLRVSAVYFRHRSDRPEPAPPVGA